ncbi:DNA-directed RNA polymerase II subunit rpb1-like [Miscanthus floridulus]|uniref:DNA-directed RNA polymerase II subunit rpb1-like n=1 Tax=Miscanthus floridulus TaxID=154761 RepID=UPI003459A9FA
MVASLAEFNDPISDRQLVLTLFRGLNDKFRHMVSNMKMQQPFPTFDGARTLLLLEEIDLNDITANNIHATPPAPSALVAAPTPPPQRPPALAPAGSGAPAGLRNPRRRGRGDKSSGGTGGPRHGGGAPFGPGMGHTNPWSGTVQLWPHGYSGLSGHMLRPPSAPYDHPQPAFNMLPYYPATAPGFAPPPPGFTYGGVAPKFAPSSASLSGTPPLPTPWNPMSGGSWDQTSLVNNFNTMSLTPPTNPAEWYADSSAGSHMTAHSVRRFTTDNNCSIEFDPFDLSVKDLQTRSVIARCNSTGDLYPFFTPTSSIPVLLLTLPPHLSHPCPRIGTWGIWCPLAGAQLAALWFGRYCCCCA